MFKIVFKILIFFLFVVNFSFSQDTTKASRKTVFLADVSVAENIENLSNYKIEAALSLAMDLTNKYVFLTSPDIDSLLKQNNVNSEITAIQIAKKLKINKIMFLRINRLSNMLRVELTTVLTKDEKKKSSGIGYSQLSYKDTSNNYLYDASLLQAIQRAFAASENAPNLYAGLEGKLIAYPVEPLIIG